jgi:putative tryptophan/tyrosine transport system substrate-binding protein
MQFDRLKRREFITLLGGAAAAWPLVVRAQPADKTYRVGFLGYAPNSRDRIAGYNAFGEELRKRGFTEGKNLTIEKRFLDEDARNPQDLAAELIRSNVDVLFADGPEATLKAATTASDTVPIVMAAINYDPLARGYVSSLSRPSGNVTGVFFQQTDLAQKQVELMVQTFPDRTTITALWDALSADQFNVAAQAAKLLHVDLRSFKLENPPYDFDTIFRKLTTEAPQMLLVLSSPYFSPQQEKIAKLATQMRLPTMFIFKSYVEVGGLMSYGADFAAMHRAAATYAAKILRGAKPSDLPIEQPTKFEFVINLKTAKAIGITLPTSALLRADEVIE